MSERKVINKYYPPEYEPEKLRRVKGSKQAQTKVRMALPMSVQCINCGNFMARNSKFNARKEAVVNESYLGIHVLRFYFRCSKCFQELTIKTDPKNSDYIVEHGLKAGFVNHVAAREEEEREQAETELLTQGDAMKMLEKKSMDTKAEIELNEAIDDVLYIKSMRSKLTTDELHERAKLASQLLSEDSGSSHGRSGVNGSNTGLEDEDLDELARFEAKRISANKKRSLPSSSTISSLSNSGLHSSNSMPANIQFWEEINDEEEEEEEEDPIAKRSRIAMERMKQKQMKDSKKLLDDIERVSATEIQENLKAPDQQKSHVPDSVVSIAATPSLTPVGAFKAPFAKFGPKISPIVKISPIAKVTLVETPVSVVKTSNGSSHPDG